VEWGGEGRFGAEGAVNGGAARRGGVKNQKEREKPGETRGERAQRPFFVSRKERESRFLLPDDSQEESSVKASAHGPTVLEKRCVFVFLH
jgi:hypothetical protein